MPVQIADIRVADRPRERLDRLGPALLTDAELVALILRSGGSDTSAIALAQRLLATHGGITGLSEKGREELVHERLVGPAKASSLAAAFELGRRVSSQAAPEATRVRGAEDVVAVVRPHLRETGREESFVIVLDPRRRVLRVARLTVGTDDRCLLSTRDVLQTVLTERGAAFALVHTHPSGDPRPSSEDVAVTRSLQTAAEAVGIEMLDHVIVAGRKWSTIPQL